MRYEHAKVLIEWAKLMGEISRSRASALGLALDTVTDANITQTKGYRDLRAFHAHLPKRKLEAAIADMKRQMVGIRQVMAIAKQTGEPLELGDLEISTFTADGAPLPAPPKMQPATEEG